MPSDPRRGAARLLAALLVAASLAACATAPSATARHLSRHQPTRHRPARVPSGPGQSQRGAPATATQAAAAGTPAPAPAPPTGPPGTTVPGAPNCPMFPADNVWNTDISRLPADPHSAAWLRSMAASTTSLHPDFGPNPGGYPYGLPYAIVTKAHPTVRLRFQYASDSDRKPYPFGPDTPIEGGRGAGGDRHALMVNSSNCALYELYAAYYARNGSRAGSGAIWRLNSNALRPAGFTSADAAGLPILPGLLNFAQVEHAVMTGTPIRHAIRFTADQTRSAYIWPARHSAGAGTSQNLPPMGARFRLSARFNVRGFCGDTVRYCIAVKDILREMQHYGLILADNGSNWFFQGAAFPQWPDALIGMLKQVPAGAFQAVNESCLMVRPNSGQATAKPGCPVG